MAEDFEPYWLIHEPGKESGFATVPGGHAQTPEQAIGAWRATAPAAHVKLIDTHKVQMTARLITEPLYPE